MRILHTADWHLGKIVNEFSMLELQEEYFNHLVEEIEDLDVDVLLVAGDLYDRAIPPKEAVHLVNQLFTKITQELNVPILVIGGNHDSQERIEYGAELLSASQLYIEGTTKDKIRKVTIDGVNFYLIPYDDHRMIKNVLADEEIKNSADALKAQLELIEEGWDDEAVNILIYHHFIINAKASEKLTESDSERPLNIGALDYIPVELVEKFDYVALGHLHKAQKVKHDHIRYSGSPLKYSKSEANHKKQNILIEITKDSLDIQPVEIKLSKDLRVIKGFFEEIMTESSEDYVFFELEDTQYVLDAMNQLRRNYPYTMGLEYVNHKQVEENDVFHSKENIQKLSMKELFSDFYEHYIGMPLNEEQKAEVQEILEETRGARES